MFRPLLISALLTALSLPAAAQTFTATASGITTTFSPATIEGLPSSGTLGGLFETTVPELISDRIEGGGMSVGSPPRFGARGSSWTQTAFYLGEIDFTDAGASGTQLLFLDPAMLQSVEVTTAMMPIERSAPGNSVRMIPRQPSVEWQGRAEVFSAPPSLALPSIRTAPAIASLRTWNRAAAWVSGPVRDRLGVLVGAVVNNSTRFERADPTVLRAFDNSAFAHVVFTPGKADELSAVIAGHWARVPFLGRSWFGQPDARQRSAEVLVESRWSRHARQVWWTTAGGYARSASTPDAESTPIVYVDSVRDMPVMNALSTSASRRQWSAVLRASASPAIRSRWLRSARAGVEIGEMDSTDRTPLASLIAEKVEEVPARVWQVATPGTGPRRSATRAMVYVAESIPVRSRFTIDAGVRWESVAAAADAGETIQWRDWFPRVSFKWDLASQNRLSAFAGIGRYGYRLPLEILAYGDPAAPTAQVFRWDDRNGDGRLDVGEEGPLVARFGGAPRTSSIDPHLRRPYLDELVIGFEVHPSASWALRVAGLTRQERHLVASVNTGVPASGYALSTIPDAGADLLDPADDQLLPEYSRRPEAFGADRYLLTNPPGFSTTFDGVELTVQHTGARLQAMAGATAGRSSGPAAARGFQVFENDSSVPGDLFSNPNAATFARGSFFSDRSYTIKTSGVYRFAHDVRLGIAARYQDGQSFSRLVIAPDLAQGAEAIRAYRNGRTRFTYTLTVDGRLQKGFPAGRERLAVVVDVFNLLNMSNEVEESVVTGPAFRQTTAVQPPRTMHIGVRVTF